VLKLGSKGFVQLDLMLSDDINWSKFAWHSTDFRITKSKYKAVYRNICIIKVTSAYTFEVVKSEQDIGKIKKGDVLQIDKYTLDLSKGLTRTVKSYRGSKPDTIIKTPKTIDKFLVTNNPEEFVKLIFGDDFTIQDVDNFESILSVLKNKKFRLYDRRHEIVKEIIETLKEQELAIPIELENF